MNRLMESVKKKNDLSLTFIESCSLSAFVQLQMLLVHVYARGHLYL